MQRTTHVGRHVHPLALLQQRVDDAHVTVARRRVDAASTALQQRVRYGNVRYGKVRYGKVRLR